MAEVILARLDDVTIVDVANTGTVGVGLYKGLSGTTAQFYKINPASTKVSFAIVASDRIDIDVVEASLNIGNMGGILASDAAHGTRGGGTLHADVVAAGASGFMTGADKTKLDGIEAGAEVNDVTSVFSRTGAVVAQNGDYNAGQVTFTPNGSIASTTVQAAVQEVRDEAQPLDADLTALAALASTGILVRSAADTYALRSVAGTASQISVANGSGVSANPTISAVIASQAQAEAGADNTSLMTALRTAQAIAALASGKVVLIENKAGASAVASLDFVTGIGSTYVYYFFSGWLAPVTDDVKLYLRISRDGGSNWQADAGDYSFQGANVDHGNTNRFLGSSSATQMEIGSNDATLAVGNASGEKIQFPLLSFARPDASEPTMFEALTSWKAASGALVGGRWTAQNTEALGFNGVQFFFESGNIASYNVSLFGISFT